MISIKLKLRCCRCYTPTKIIKTREHGMLLTIWASEQDDHKPMGHTGQWNLPIFYKQYSGETPTVQQVTFHSLLLRQSCGCFNHQVAHKLSCCLVPPPFRLVNPLTWSEMCKMQHVLMQNVNASTFKSVSFYHTD